MPGLWSGFGPGRGKPISSLGSGPLMDTEPPPAALRGESVIILSTIDWDFIWQSHHEVATRLAAAGNKVLFIENTGVRPPNLSDFPRIARRLKNWWGGVKGFREVLPNIVVLSPLVLPLPYSRLAHVINTWLIGRSIASWVRASGSRPPILWTFLPTPLALSLVEAADPSVVVYFCVSGFAESSAEAAVVAASEAELVARADLVFASSEALKAKCAAVRSDVVLFPLGVNFERFSAARGGAAAAELASIPKPRFGYVGGVHRWVDLGMLAQLSELMPDAQFVLVGPLQTDIGPLRGRPNIHLLGARPHEDLAPILAGFDAGLIPYRRAPFTDSVYPSKINEYHAMGLPVVSTRLPEVEAYNLRHGGVVAVADDAVGFAAALASAAKSGSEGRAARLAAARENGWDVILPAMMARVAGILERKDGPGRPWAEVARRLQWKAPRVLVAGAAAAAALAMLIRYSPALWWAAEPLRVSHPPVSADAAVALAGGAGEGGQPGRAYEESAMRAVELYNSGYVRRIVFSSGVPGVFDEVAVMKALAVSEGVPAGAIDTVERGSGTRAMLVEAHRVVRASGCRKVLLVSSPYHMRRAALAMRKLDPVLEVVPVPVRECRFYGIREDAGTLIHSRRPAWRHLQAVLQEYLTLVYYWMHSWV
ncbi:glycosyltransferase [bacterium]|nr:MAG: glycosyltransferase [bacterium]